MNKALNTVFGFGCVIAITLNASAQTTDFTDGEHLTTNTTTDSLITTPDNWDLGLPVGQQGTISIDSGYDNDSAGSLVDYNILHTGGTFSRSGGNSGLVLDSSDWELDGGTFGASVRGITLLNASTFTVTSGLYQQENNRDVTLSDASSITVNNGTFAAGRSIRLNDGSTFTINNGVASTTGTFGQGGFISGAGTMNLNGGTLTGDRFVFQQSGTIANFGGTTVGTVTFNDWGTGNGAGTSGDRMDDRNISINFLTGSQMTMTMGSAARELDFNDDTVGDAGTAWAEALWNTDRLTFGGQSSTDLGGLSWTDASSSSVGLGGGEYFEFTPEGTYGGSLSLNVIPEPSTIALLGLAGLAGFFFLRRR
jgi:hypothetical protein